MSPRNGPVVLLLDSSGPGGIESHVLALAELLRSRGVMTKIVLLKDHGDNPFLHRLRRSNIPFEILGGGLIDLIRFVRRTQPRLIHTHGYKGNILGRIACTLTKTPLVSSFHAGERAPFPVGQYQLLDAYSSWIGKRVSVSSDIAARLPCKSVVIPNFIANRSSEMPDCQGMPRIAFVGRLSPEKGPDRFCRIAQKIGPVARWEIFGDGPLRDELRSAFEGLVTFHGFKTTPEDIYPGLDLVLMPSRAEGLPMAALEAMSFGIPVIATDVGGLAGLVKDGRTGWLLPSTDDDENETTAVAAILTWLACDPAERKHMSCSARTHVSTVFGEDQAWLRFKDVYRDAGCTLS